MPFPMSLTEEEYSALVTLAREGTKDADGVIIPERARRLDTFLRMIERKSGVMRSGVWVQWQEMDQKLPATTSFPDKWPPELRQYIELVSRPVAKADVEAMLAVKARRPTNVLVTSDPDAKVGWSTLDSFFLT
jgi:hypothetical protein